MSAGSASQSGATPEPPRDVVIVKLGGSLITDKASPSTPRPAVMARLAEEIRDALPGLEGGLLVGHGSGSFGHVAAAESGFGDGPFTAPGKAASASRLRGLATTGHQAAQLHRLVMGALLAAQVNPWSWAASSGLTAKAGKPRRGHVQPLLRALQLGLLPVVYGDVVLDDAWGATICSTETLIQHLVGHLQRAGRRIKGLVWCGETDGIYDRSGRTIRRVDDANIAHVRRQLTAARGVDVTGGMHLRLATCRTLARRGIASWLVNGRTAGQLHAALTGGDIVGTHIVAGTSM